MPGLVTQLTHFIFTATLWGESNDYPNITGEENGSRVNTTGRVSSAGFSGDPSIPNLKGTELQLPGIWQSEPDPARCHIASTFYSLLQGQDHFLIFFKEKVLAALSPMPSGGLDPARHYKCFLPAATSQTQNMTSGKQGKRAKSLILYIWMLLYTFQDTFTYMILLDLYNKPVR